MEHFLLVSFFILIILIISLFHKKAFSTPNGAIIMAFGIMSVAIVQQTKLMSQETAIIQLALLLTLFIGYLSNAIKFNNFKESHFTHPIKSFAVGTWVAGTSVSIIVMNNGFPELKSFFITLFMLNVILWIFYMKIVIRNYNSFFQNRKLLLNANGVLLLACVATQSIVVSGKTLFSSLFPNFFAVILFVFGLLLYVFGVISIVYNLLKNREFTLSNDWQNTNCIIHGALSISGLASTKVSTISPNISAIIWLLILTLFIIVEIIEIIRGIKRVSNLGWLNGVFTYSTSQWSRNLTFGMLFVFTMSFRFDESFLSSSRLFNGMYEKILTIGLFVVVCLFIIESGLFLSRTVAHIKINLSKREIQEQ